MTHHYMPVDQGPRRIVWPYWHIDRDFPARSNLPESEEQINIEEFGRRLGLDDKEIRILQVLFGPFASRNELLANVRRRPRFR